MIYKTFEEWKNGYFLEDGEPRTEAYTEDELLLIEMGWGYGFDAGAAAMKERCAKVCAETKDKSGVNDDGRTWLERATKHDCAKAIRALGDSNE